METVPQSPDPDAVAHADQAERALLGMVLNDPTLAPRLLALPAGLFRREAWNLVREAIHRLADQGLDPDLVTVQTELEAMGQLQAVGGSAVLVSLVEDATSALLWPDYVTQVLTAYQRRALAGLAHRIARDTEDGQPPAAVMARGLAELAALEAEAHPGDPELRREGLDLALRWPDGVRFGLAAIRNGRDGGVRGELTITRMGRRVSWGTWPLSSTSARESLRRTLHGTEPGVPWGERLEEAAYQFTQAAREDEPFVILTGELAPASRALVPHMAYEGEPTLVYADGDTGKSLFATAFGFAVHSGHVLPAGLRPARAVPVAFLDWETSEETLNHRLGLLAAGFGVAPPPILYKRMRRPLAEEAAALAAEFARRKIGLVIVDSNLYAMQSLEGVGFAEPMTAFYTALRLFAPAACLVLSHVTNLDARTGGASRPFGGAFAFNAPRLIWEARRDYDVPGTAIVFTCKKANNLPQRPDSFGLQFLLEAGATRLAVSRFDLAEAAPEILAHQRLPERVGRALATEPLSVAALAEQLHVPPDRVRRVLNRYRDRRFIPLADSTPTLWAIKSVR
jgi:DnaB-like helicase N terminal domain/AAA domain